MCKELELSNAQVERVDEVENAVYQMCCVLADDPELEWNMEYIGEIADLVAELLAKQGHRVRYPAIVTEPDGSQHIVEYVER